MSVIRSNNDTLKKQLAELRSLREAKEQKTKEVNETPRKVVKKDRRNIPGIVIFQVVLLFWYFSTVWYYCTPDWLLSSEIPFSSPLSPMHH